MRSKQINNNLIGRYEIEMCENRKYINNGDFQKINKNACGKKKPK